MCPVASSTVCGGWCLRGLVVSAHFPTLTKMPSTSAAGKRVALRSFERLMTLSDDAYVMVAHVLLVKGQTQHLIRHLPAALMKTFNRHPRMRIKLLKDEFSTGRIQPLLSLDDIEVERVLYVTQTNADGLSNSAYQSFLQKMAHTPYDRYNEFPYKLHVWVDDINEQARLILLSDHYVSDGSSGNTILNDVLTFAAELSRDPATSLAVTEMPLHPSLFETMLDEHPNESPQFINLVTTNVRSVLQSAPMFTHVIAPNAAQEDFRMPEPPKNPSTLLFAEGSKTNLDKIVAKCREEKTTFFGALAASIFLSYIVTSDSVDDEAFKLTAFMNFNMRERLLKPIDPQSVGCIITLNDMNAPTLNVPGQRFWDLARMLKTQSNHAHDVFAATAIPMILLDQYFNRQSDPKLYEDFPTKCSSLADVDISSVGRYPYKTSHAFATGDLTLESLQYTGRVPFLGAAAFFYATSLHQVGYSIGHHYDQATGKKLFDTAVAVMEQSWSIHSDETLVDAINKLNVSKPQPTKVL